MCFHYRYERSSRSPRSGSGGGHAQRREKRAKEKIASEKGINKSKGLLIHAIYRHGQYLSKACIKGNVGQVDQILRSLISRAAQRRFLRSEIETRTLCLGGEFAKLFSITWLVGVEFDPLMNLRSILNS